MTLIRLEKPCLPHVKYAYLSETGQKSRGEVPYNSGPGHVFTVSAALVHQHRQQDPANSSFDLPKVDIDRLLDASRSLDLEEEVTPVQIWASIREISIQQVVNSQTLQALTDEFCKYVRCNRFVYPF